MTTFKDLKIGDKFIFSSESKWWSLGMIRGPWIKISTRRYKHDAPAGLIYTVGTVQVEVTNS